MTADLVLDPDHVLDIEDQVVHGLMDDLLADIQQHLADQPPRTAHPLVTLPTDVLVDQALGELAARPTPSSASAEQPPNRSPLTGIWAVLPDSLLALRRPRGPVDHRPLTVAEHLELTAAVLEHSGWARTGHRVRTWRGRRCILGAQIALYLAGYGDTHTANAAGTHLNQLLAERGIRERFPIWNEAEGRTRDEVLELLHTAAARARH
jgi:hypothetical protein